MSRRFFFRFAFIGILLYVNSAKSQTDPFAYTMTATNKGGNEWVALRKLDSRTGEFSSILTNVKEHVQHLIEFPGGKAYAYQVVSDPVIGSGNLNPQYVYQVVSNPVIGSGNLNPQLATGSSVAALAYDRKSNRLFYTPMNKDQLNYIDLSTMESFVCPDQFFSKAGNFDIRNTGPINRLVIAPNGYGYTITNDGNHMLRFTTNGSPIITDLGDLIDDPQNKEMTIHSLCANSGGDMVADDAGHLYLITGTNKVFKVDIATKISTYLATVSGLPQKFTTSGLAVGENGKELLISSSVYTETLFSVDPETWNATPSRATHEIYESADLANSNVLITKSTAYSNLFLSESRENSNRIRIFPNPALFDEVSIQFNAQEPGNYTIQLVNLFGKKLLQQKITIGAKTQTEIMRIPGSTAQGFYYIRILDDKDNIVNTQKLVIERW